MSFTSSSEAAAPKACSCSCEQPVVPRQSPWWSPAAWHPDALRDCSNGMLRRAGRGPSLPRSPKLQEALKQPHNCLAQAFTRQGRQECGRALLETWVGEMLHEPVALDGYGALMIPAKVSELGPAVHRQFVLKTSTVCPAAWSLERTISLLTCTAAAVWPNGHDSCSNDATATRQKQKNFLLSLDDLASAP